MSSKVREFYNDAWQRMPYLSAESSEQHPLSRSLREFVATCGLSDKKCLEVGSGRGLFQFHVGDYVGIDLSSSVGRLYSTAFAVAEARRLPFESESFDGLWTITVLEHVPEPEQALAEIWRVLRPGGFLFLAPAWQCRSWAAEGYPVRPYSDLHWKGRAIKASIPLRDSLPYRAITVGPKRVARLLSFLVRRRPMEFRYRKLAANYETFWMSDSDAVNSMDPFEACLWYLSRGARCLNYPTLLRALAVRTGPLLLQKPEAA